MMLKDFKYNVAVLKNRVLRRLKWIQMRSYYSKTYDTEVLPYVVYCQKSLILRRLGNVDLRLQENKAVNLELASKKLHKILIKPNEIFSFWNLVGSCTERKGYLEGLILKGGKPHKGIGGGMCQLTNLIHWLILHSPLEIIEHHHHNGYDLFPDYGRQIPFGTGTSIMYNYLDYQFKNMTNETYQLCIWIKEGYLFGELRSNKEETYSYRILEENAFFSKIGDDYYRFNEIYKEVYQRNNGKLCSKSLLIKNCAKVMYDASFIPEHKIVQV